MAGADARDRCIKSPKLAQRELHPGVQPGRRRLRRRIHQLLVARARVIARMTRTSQRFIARESHEPLPNSQPRLYESRGEHRLPPLAEAPTIGPTPVALAGRLPDQVVGSRSDDGAESDLVLNQLPKSPSWRSQSGFALYVDRNRGRITPDVVFDESVPDFVGPPTNCCSQSMALL